MFIEGPRGSLARLTFLLWSVMLHTHEKTPTYHPVGLACCGFPATIIKSYGYQGTIITPVWRRVLLAKMG